MSENKDYKIPSPKKITKWVFLIPVLGLVLLGVMVPSMQAGLPIYIAVSLVLTMVFRSGRFSVRQKKIWLDHNFAWYRNSFPEHSHPNGNVSCRHCGSYKTRVTNLMQRTFMRVHSCNQCGETLYFSEEKV